MAALTGLSVLFEVSTCTCGVAGISTESHRNTNETFYCFYSSLRVAVVDSQQQYTRILKVSSVVLLLQTYSQTNTYFGHYSSFVLG